MLLRLKIIENHRSYTSLFSTQSTEMVVSLHLLDGVSGVDDEVALGPPERGRGRFGRSRPPLVPGASHIYPGCGNQL